MGGHKIGEWDWSKTGGGKLCRPRPGPKTATVCVVFIRFGDTVLFALVTLFVFVTVFVKWHPVQQKVKRSKNTFSRWTGVQSVADCGRQRMEVWP